MKCPKCGKEVSDSAKFCPQCGNELKRIPSPTKTKKKSKFKWIALLILVVLVVLFCAVVKKWGNRNSDLNSDSNSDFSSNVDSDSEYLAAIENYAEVNDAVMELVASSDYETSDTSGKAEKVLELLAQLENDGQIADNSVNYNETARIITYQYADGVYGSVMLEKTANDIGGIGASSYVEEYDEDGLVKRTSNSVDFGLEGCPYEEQLSALILYGWGEGHDKELQILRDEQQKSWTDEYMETTIEEDCTVAKFRTELTGNDFITIQLHGYVYNEIPTIYLQELTPFSMRVANSLNIKKLSEEEKQYLDDLKANRIGTMCSADDSKYHYFILPEFFTYYYANNLLDNTIIWLGCCDGYRNDLLVRAFADCGAKSVLGCTESVRIAYNLFMQEAFVYMLLYGNTVDESLCFAKSIWGDNDQIFSTNYLSVEDTDPAEVRYYNGGNETLVTLTADAETELEKKSVNDVDFHDKLTELIENMVFSMQIKQEQCVNGVKSGLSLPVF
ncbi:MAG: zinc ribbon domain-containing protein [Fusicatenibacter sp.]|nr:zinc ribbon domain-containing protein [Lachnospiraceae bacterium]MDY2938605.1 zinc ribbon domain-containing protein [Fusicatenibacter sp.]